MTTRIIEFDRDELHVLKEIVKPELVELDKKVFSSAEISILKDLTISELKSTREYLNSHLNDDIKAYSDKYNVLYRIKLKVE